MNVLRLDSAVSRITSKRAASALNVNFKRLTVGGELLLGRTLPRLPTPLTGRYIVTSSDFSRASSLLGFRAMSTRAKVPLDSQKLDAPLTSCATFLVLTINDRPDAIDTVKATLASVADLSKNVAFRDLNAMFSCNVGIGSEAWDRLVSSPRPRELHPFVTIKGQTHTAPSTPGDLLFHIRSGRRDLNFEFERQLMDSLGDSATVVDETIGFRYFDSRDLLGFVDGTANPIGPDVVDSVFITSEDDDGAQDGSYIVVQKYLHDLKAWQSLSTETQEAIIGRTKLDNIELDDAEDGKQQAHKTLATIEDEHGVEHDILRDNMPFGSPGSKEFGTFFIGYSRKLWVIEKMLERMFVGYPPGLHDRILNVSRAITGTTFFAPSATFLASLGD